jgi:hypothetical protein
MIQNDTGFMAGGQKKIASAMVLLAFPLKSIIFAERFVRLAEDNYISVNTIG